MTFYPNVWPTLFWEKQGEGMWGAVMKTTIKRKRKSKNKIENQQKVKNKGKPDYLLNNSVCVRQKFVYKSEICYIYAVQFFIQTYF